VGEFCRVEENIAKIMERGLEGVESERMGWVMCRRLHPKKSSTAPGTETSKKNEKPAWGGTQKKKSDINSMVRIQKYSTSDRKRGQAGSRETR